MKIIDVLNRLWSIIDISQQNVLPIVNLALEEIYLYSQDWDPVLWDFMLKRESFMVTPWFISESLQTSYPIYEIKNFFCWTMPWDIDFKAGCCVEDSCNCFKALPECKCGCETIDYCWCSCSNPDEPLNLLEKSAKSKLPENSYQIISWPCNFWWFWWQIIKVNIWSEWCKCGADWLRVEYYSWFNELKCLTNKFPLPRQFMLAFLHIFQSLLLMRTDPEESAIMYNRFINKMKTLRSFKWNTLYSIEYGNKG